MTVAATEEAMALEAMVVVETAVGLVALAIVSEVRAEATAEAGSVAMAMSPATSTSRFS